MAYQRTKEAVNDLLRAQPENSEFLIQLAWADTWLGDKAAALAHAKTGDCRIAGLQRRLRRPWI